MSKGVIQTDTILDRILAQTTRDLALRKGLVTESRLAKEIVQSDRVPLSLATALRMDQVSVIAEVKRGSPSRGIFPVEVDPKGVAAAYRNGGAAAISCLTDGPFFHGSQQDLEIVAEVAHRGDIAIPIIRKDFVVDPYQLLEARAWGADAVLLIVAALNDALLTKLYQCAVDFGLSVLVEVHDEAEADRALKLNPSVVGVNNRNLKTFEVDLGITETIASLVPADTLLVSESGIFAAHEVAAVAAWGADAVLVGESLIVQDDRGKAVRALAHVPRTSARQVWR
ncbi:indole-3-glycerol phosphate synthase TrpC [soil metagenome]